MRFRGMKAIKLVEDKLYYGVLIRFILESYLEILISALLHLKEVTLFLLNTAFSSLKLP